MKDLERIWEATEKVFPVLNRNLTESAVHTNDDFELIITTLQRLDLAEIVYETIYYDIKIILSQQTSPQFWSYFESSTEDDNAYDGFDRFQISIKWLWREYSKYQEIIERIKIFKQMCQFSKRDNKERNDEEYFGEMFKSALLSKIPLNFTAIVNQFYRIILNMLINLCSGQSMDGIDGAVFKCDGCERDDCRCEKLMTAFTVTSSYLHEMGLFNRIAEHSVINLIKDKIQSYVKNTCQGSSDVSHFERLEKWLHNNIFKWIMKLFIGDTDVATDTVVAHERVENLKYKFTYHLFETYAHAIIDQFFNIIIEYPDSKPSIDDLKICLVKIDLRNYLMCEVKKSLETRLLHPGVDTSDVLTGYVAAIKALRHLDSSGVLLEGITEPVKDYLKMRADTVRCVITALTEEGPTDLAEELAKSEAIKDESKNSIDDMTNWETWMPDPVDANPKKSSSNIRSADIISMVVDIYGSKELFVNEYRNILAERLLSNLDFTIEKEIRNLELLKLRFGETLLHSSEVMLKDISDSKRINAHIQSDVEYTTSKEFEMSTLIVSSQFWPPFKKESIELAPEIQVQFDRFSKSYEAYKGNRTLNWNTLNGKVSIEIEFGDKKIDLCISTIQATIIMCFQNQNEWTLDALSQNIKLPASVLRKKLNFWQSQGLIKETSEDIFTLADENQDETIEDMNNSHEVCEDDEGDSAMASASDQKEEEFQVFWSYIVGMLINLDSLPLERIYQMLKMFAAQAPGMEFSQQELKNFLQRKVKEHKLLFAAGVYYLPK